MVNNIGSQSQPTSRPVDIQVNRAMFPDGTRLCDALTMPHVGERNEGEIERGEGEEESVKERDEEEEEGEEEEEEEKQGKKEKKHKKDKKHKGEKKKHHKKEKKHHKKHGGHKHQNKPHKRGDAAVVVKRGHVRLTIENGQPKLLSVC